MRVTMLFPGDFYSLNNVNDNFSAEVDAAVSCDCFDVLLFNFDEYIDGAPLKLSKPAENCSKSLVYRGWMMKPKEYERLYSDLVKLGFDPITKPGSYEKMHCFPNAATSFVGQTPNILVFPAQDGKVEVDASLINSTFDRFLIKDYVKSVKGSSFPSSIQTPVTQEEIDELVKRFVELRGPLFTGGIVIKEYVELKRYGKATNEWREFKFIRGSRVSLERNSNQPKDCPKPPEDYLMTRNQVIAPFYTVDYAELEDGSWTIVEVGEYYNPECGYVALLGQFVPIRTFATHSRLAPSHLRLFQTNNAQIILQTCRWVTSHASHLRQLLCNCCWWLACDVAPNHTKGEDLAALPCPISLLGQK